jgi:hypothetical protein
MQEIIMNALFNKVLLNRKNSVAIIPSQHKADDVKVIAIMADIAQLGYTLDNDVISVLKTYSDNELSTFHKFLVPELKEMVGANVRYVPLFKKFPQDIPDDIDHLVLKIVGYFQNFFKINPQEYTALSCGHIIDKRLFNLADFGACPICEQQVDELMEHDDSHKPLENTHQFKVIKLADESAVYTIFSNVVGSRSPISETDKEFITDIVKHELDNVVNYLPEEITQKEIIALLGGLLLEYTQSAEAVLLKHVKTSTDVLRLAVQICDGDVSLKDNTKFKLTNGQRRIVMTLLNNVKCPEIDMLRYRSMWLRLGEVLHVGTDKNKKKFPVAYNAFNLLRNDQKSIMTFNKKVEQLLVAAIKVKNNKVQMAELLKLLETRAGDFARRLDFVLRVSANKKSVIDSFKSVIHSLTTPMILSLKSHFKGRSVKSDFRFYVPKGKMAKVQFSDGDDRDQLSVATVNKLLTMFEKELLNRFSKEESLGRVFIDESLKKILVPLSQRSASKALLTVPRGSRMSVDKNAPFIRLFTYWKDSCDVDLAAIAFDKDWNHKDQINYYSLSSYGKSVHSGDIRSGTKGAVEFIDIDVDAFKKSGIRYVAITTIVYTGEPFSSFECSAGYMERQNPDGRQFDATTVKQKFDVSSEGTYCVPLIFDLEESEVIWADFVLSGSDMYSNYHNTSEKLVNIAKVAVKLADIKPNIYDLFMLQAKARATQIDVKKKSDVVYDYVFDLDSAMNLDEIMAKWIK